MTEQEQRAEQPRTQTQAQPSSRAIHEAIARLSSGDRAELRRDPGTSLAFYKLQATHFPDVHKDETRERWMVLVQAMALLVDLYAPNTRLGAALGEAKLSENRLTRLLRADDIRLPKQIHACARFLAAKGVRQDMTGFAWLLNVREPIAAERVRRQIAGDYFRAVSS